MIFKTFRRFILPLMLVVLSQGNCLEKLPESYVVSYGDPKASFKIIHYFSFTCPHCVALYREEFKELRAKYVESGQVYLTFHPVPMDVLTVRGMHCLENLSTKEKKVFLEAILEELIINNADFSSTLMIKAMELLGKPIPLLMEKDYLQETEAFNSAFRFLKQDEKIDAIPTVEVNGKLYPNEVPDNDFIRVLISKLHSVEEKK